MSIITGVEQTQGMTSTRLMPDIRENFYYKTRKLSPFLNFLNMLEKGDKPKNEKVQWDNSDYFYHTIITEASETGSGATTINCAAGHGSRVVAGDIIQVPSTRETILVESVSTDALSVQRSLGTAAAAIPASTTCFIIGNALYEDQETMPESKVREPTRDYNYLQHFAKSWKVTERSNDFGTYDANGKGKLYKKRRAEKMQELLRELELTLFFGQRGTDTDASSNYRTFMGGVEEYIRAASSRTTDVSGALSWTVLNQTIGVNAFDFLDTKELYGFCSPLAMAQIEDIGFNKVAPKNYNDKKLGVDITELKLAGGTVKLITEPWFTDGFAGYMFLLNPKAIKLVERKGMTIHDNTQTEGNVQKGYADTDLTVEIQQPETHYLAYGITSS